MLKPGSYSRRLLQTGLSVLLVVCLSSCSSGVTRPHTRDVSPDRVAPTIIYLVRHAEKQASDSKDPVLNEAGKIRAQALAQMLSKESIDALFASDYQRTRLTLKPLAEQKTLPVNIYDASNSIELVETILSSYAGKTVVIAGHSNTIPELVALLRHTGPLHKQATQVETQLGHNEYDRLFVVVRHVNRTPTALQLSFPRLPDPLSIQ